MDSLLGERLSVLRASEWELTDTALYFKETINHCSNKTVLTKDLLLYLYNIRVFLPGSVKKPEILRTLGIILILERILVVCVLNLKETINHFVNSLYKPYVFAELYNYFQNIVRLVKL